jgi:hypothetical protein
MPTKIQMSKMVPSTAAITVNNPAAVSSMDGGGSSQGGRGSGIMVIGHLLSGLLPA